MNKHHLFIGIAAGVIGAVVVLACWVNYVLHRASCATETREQIIVTAGESRKSVIHELRERKLWSAGQAFAADWYLTLRGGDFQPGNYGLNSCATPLSIIGRLKLGNAEEPVERVTLREGLTAVEIGAELEGRGICPAREFVAAAQAAVAEGYLFPDTYEFYRGSSVAEVVQKMRDTFEQRTVDLWELALPEPLADHREVIILASIVQLEVASADDMRKVAGVFLSRLMIGQGLESDATINYITGKSELQPSREDLDVDSLYNTYQYRGLPPGPIGNPGRLAIEAVLNPEETEYLYFLTTSTGQTVFSKTFEEHVENKARYL